MRPSIALQMKRSETLRAASRFRVANLRVFGSAARGADLEDSDLDLLADALSGATLFDLGVRVDLLTPEDLPLKLRSAILAEARPL